MKKSLCVLIALITVACSGMMASAKVNAYYSLGDIDAWKETVDAVMNWNVDNKQVLSYALDTTGVVKGANSIRIDYDLDKSPNYGTAMVYPDNEGAASPAKYDGIKLVLKASNPIRLYVRPNCDWVGGNLWIDVGIDVKEYTIRFEDVPFEKPKFDVKAAGGFNLLAISFFNEDALMDRGSEQLTGFKHQGSLWCADAYLFAGDDKTNLIGSSTISVKPRPTPTATEPKETTDLPVPTTTKPDSDGSSVVPEGTTSSVTDVTSTSDGMNATQGTSTVSNTTSTSGLATDVVPDSNLVIWFVVVGAAVLAAAGAGVAFWLLKKKQST